MSANFEHYKIFYYVAKYQNFTQAAKVLLSSQPSVTRCVQSLEHELGCRLFVRSRRGVSLTPEGELLFQYIKPACEAILQGEETLSGSLELQNGSICLGATEAALHCYLLSKLNLFHQEYPDVSIKILNNSTPQAISDLRSEKVDLAFVTTPASIDPSMKMTKLKAFRDILVGGSHFSHLKGTTLRLEDLAGYPFVSLSRSTMTYQHYEKYYASQGLVLKADIELATADLIIPVIRENLGIGFVPEDLASEALNNNTIFQIALADKLPKRHICMVQNNQKPLNIAARQLIKSIGCQDRLLPL